MGAVVGADGGEEAVEARSAASWKAWMFCNYESVPVVQ